MVSDNVQADGRNLFGVKWDMKVKNSGRKTLKVKVLIIIVALVIFQITAVFCVLLLTKTNEKLSANNVQILSNSVSFKGHALEEEMLMWSDFSSWLEETDAIGNTFEAETGTPVHMAISDAYFRRKLLNSLSETILENLRRRGTTGAFIILSDGSDSLAKDCVYLRDLNPDDLSESNHDILVEAGLGERAFEMGFTLDYNWSDKLTLPENADYYNKPMQAAADYPQMDAKNLGCWSGAMRLLDNDIYVITYTVPLLDSSNVAYGVMGIEVSLDYLGRYLDGSEISVDENGGFYLGKSDRTKGENIYSTVFVDNVYYQMEMQTDSQVLFDSGRRDDTIRHLSIDGRKTSLVSNYVELHLYNSNTPFSDERWIVAGVLEEESLYSSSKSFMLALMLAMGISLGAGIIGSFFITAYMFRPLHSMMEGLKHVSLTTESLPRTGIAEIDQLAVEVERLRHNAFQAGSKVADIIDMSNISLGIYEYQHTLGSAVFCTRKFFELTELPLEGWHENHMQRSTFLRLLEEFRSKCTLSDEDKNICYFTTEEGKRRYLEIKGVTRAQEELYIYMDVTDQVLEKEKIKHERDYDVLTNLYNRRAFVRIITGMIRENRIRTGVLSMWDLDNLKYINDTYGHDMGDKYICMMADTFHDMSVENAVAARISGDEFMVFLYNGEVETMYRSLEAVHAGFLKKKILLPDGESLSVSVSAGIAAYGTDAEDYESLVKLADFAMYEVKHKEKGNISRFCKESYERDYILVQGIGELKKLLDEKLIHFAFQPIIDIRNLKIFAYEALMRPESQILYNPELLLRVAQQQSMLRQVEKLTWFYALRQFTAQKGTNGTEKLFLNSIPNQCLSDDEFAELKRMYGACLPRVVMEITEFTRTDKEADERKEYFCNSLCMEVALDDYGAGYSSNATLINGRFGYVKIDISMIRGIHLSDEKQSFVKNVIEYCHKCNTKVVVEGVETAEEYRMVRVLGADYAQGYYFSRPLADIREVRIDFEAFES